MFSAIRGINGKKHVVGGRFRNETHGTVRHRYVQPAGVMARPQRGVAEGTKTPGAARRRRVAASFRLNAGVDIERRLEKLDGTSVPIAVVGRLVIGPRNRDVGSAMPAAKTLIIVPRRFEE